VALCRIARFEFVQLVRWCWRRASWHKDAGRERPVNVLLGGFDNLVDTGSFGLSGNLTCDGKFNMNNLAKIMP
jgi:hypothetical protein